MFDYASKFNDGLKYHAFLEHHGSEEHRRRWAGVYQEIELTSAQLELLTGFKRHMKVGCLAGTWCGDCVNQCPIFERFAEATPTLDIRYFDRDAHPDLASELKICGGARVPTVVFPGRRWRASRLVRRPHADQVSAIGARSAWAVLSHGNWSARQVDSSPP